MSDLGNSEDDKVHGDVACEIFRLVDACQRQEAKPDDVGRLEALLLQAPQAVDLYLAYVADSQFLRAWSRKDAGTPLPQTDAGAGGPPRETAAPAAPGLAFLHDVQQQGWGLFSHHLLLFSLLGILIAGGVAGVLARRAMSRRPAVQLAAAPLADPLPAHAAADHRQAAEALADAAASLPLAVARIGRTTDCHWINTGAALATGARLQPGQQIDIARGQVEIDFDCEAVVVLYGPGILLVKSNKEVELLMGHAMARAATCRGHGFTISTRTTTALDLGTEFHVRAAPDGHSEVYVTEGAVEVRARNSSGRHRLEAGQTAQVEPGEAGIVTVIEGGSNTPDYKFPTIEPPSKDDYADRSQHHATIRVVQGTLNHDSGPIDRLLDGCGQSMSDAPEQSAFFADNTQHGRILLDLGKVALVHKINTYSWHVYNLVEAGCARRDSRATQRYTLYGYSGDASPATDGDLASHGWKLISRVNTDEFFTVPPVKNRPAQQAVSTTGIDGKVGQYRFLLWDVEPTHVDAYPPPLHSVDENTFFGEFDVYAE